MADGVIEEIRPTRIRDPSVPVRALSGGNLEKVVVAADCPPDHGC